jgi:hypothetical protein
MKKLFLLAMVLGLLAVGCAETGKWVCKGQCKPFETSLASCSDRIKRAHAAGLSAIDERNSCLKDRGWVWEETK